MTAGAPLRVLFVNENIGGNATMHLHLRRVLARDHPDVCAEFLDVPPRGPLRRVVGAAVPGLAHLDLDLAPLRGQLALSAHVHRRLRRRREVDALHVYTHNAALLSVGVLRKTPTVVGLDATSAQSLRLLPYRSPTRFTDRAVPLGQGLERRVYDAAAALVVKSGWAFRSLVEEYGVDPGRISIIPYGIDVPAPPPVARQSDLIAFVGRSMQRKGGWLLLEAWRRLKGSARLLLITPEDVPPEPGLTVVRDLHPGDARLQELLASAAVLAFPSTGDTFGYAVLEAMAVGTPVIAADATALPELVSHRRTGLLVPPQDVDQLVIALEEALGDPLRREAWGRAAREDVLKRFDARRTTAQAVDLLRAVAGRGPTGPGAGT